MSKLGEFVQTEIRATANHDASLPQNAKCCTLLSSRNEFNSDHSQSNHSPWVHVCNVGNQSMDVAGPLAPNAFRCPQPSGSNWMANDNWTANSDTYSLPSPKVTNTCTDTSPFDISYLLDLVSRTLENNFARWIVPMR